MTLPAALGRLIAGQTVYRWDDRRQQWTRVLEITHDPATRRYTLLERTRVAGPLRRHCEPLSQRDRLTADLPAQSAGGIHGKYRPSPTRF